MMIRRRIIPRGMQRRQQRLEKVASRPVEASATAVAMRTSYSTAGCSVRIGYPSSQPLLLAVRPSSSPQQQRSGSSSMYERSEAVSIASAPAAKAPPPAAVYSNSRENTPFYTTNKGGVAWRSAVIVADSRRSFGTGSIAVGGQWHRSILTRAGGGRGPVGGGGGDSAGASFGPGQSSALRQRAMATLSEGEFHDVADDALEGINDAVERSLEDGFDGDFDCNMSQGVLNIVVTGRGTWVLNKQSPNRQIWWSSPVSGPMRFEYDYDGRRWLNTRDGVTELRSLLTAELKDKCGVDVDPE